MGEKIDTGIFILVVLEGKIQHVDIGDPRIPIAVLVEWIRHHSGSYPHFAERLIVSLLNRREEYEHTFHFPKFKKGSSEQT